MNIKVDKETGLLVKYEVDTVDLMATQLLNNIEQFTNLIKEQSLSVEDIEQSMNEFVFYALPTEERKGTPLEAETQTVREQAGRVE